MSTPPTSSATPASPCVRNCCLDEDNVCLGCGRSLEEIVAWGAAGDREKLAILERSQARAAERRQRQETWTVRRGER